MRHPLSFGRASVGVRHPLALLTCALLLHPAWVAAQGIHKIVGPDGRVTYSDVPPANAPAAAGSPSRDPRSAPSQASAPPSSHAAPGAPPAPPGAKRATAVDPAAPPPAAPAAANRELVTAVVAALGYEDLVNRAEDLCIKALPTSMARYSAATQGWHTRNVAWVSSARQVLTTSFDAPTQGLVRARIDAYNASQLQQVQRADQHARIKWCDRSMDEIQGGVMDLGGKPVIAGPLSRLK